MIDPMSAPFMHNLMQKKGTPTTRKLVSSSAQTRRCSEMSWEIEGVALHGDTVFLSRVGKDESRYLCPGKERAPTHFYLTKLVFSDQEHNYFRLYEFPARKCIHPYTIPLLFPFFFTVATSRKRIADFSFSFRKKVSGPCAPCTCERRFFEDRRFWRLFIRDNYSLWYLRDIAAAEMVATWRTTSGFVKNVVGNRYFRWHWSRLWGFFMMYGTFRAFLGLELNSWKKYEGKKLNCT